MVNQEPDADPEDLEFPCDDHFENEATGENVVFRSTYKAHFVVPHEFSSVEEVLKLGGVKLERSWFEKIPL